MLFRMLSRWLGSSSERSRQGLPVRRRRTIVPRLETLENRFVPAFLAPEELLGVPSGAIVKVGDINNDSRPDIVTAQGSNLNVSVYWSPGVYTQTFHASLAAPIKDVAVGKINADAYDDVVVATGEKTLNIFLGRSDGRVGAPIRVTMPKAPYSTMQFALNLALGDVTGDGKMDLVVGAESSTYKDNHPGFGYYNIDLRDSLATVLVGKGDGTFRTGSTVWLDTHGIYSSGAPTPFRVPVAIGDVNGDGKRDVVAASFGQYAYLEMPPLKLLGDYHVHLLTGDGQGKFQKDATLWANGTPWSRSFQDSGYGLPVLAVRDLNGDGRDDIVAAYPGGYQGGTSLHISVSDPSTGQFVTTGYAFSGTPAAVAVDDVTGDGKLDIVVATRGGGVEVQPGNGDGTFQAAQTFAPGASFTAMILSDLDRDGDVDLILLDGTSAFQMLNNQPW